MTESLSLCQLSGSRGTRVSLRVGEMCLQCLLLFNADQQKAVIAFWVTALCTSQVLPRTKLPNQRPGTPHADPKMGCHKLP